MIPETTLGGIEEVSLGRRTSGPWNTKARSSVFCSLGWVSDLGRTVPIHTVEMLQSLGGTGWGQRTLGVESELRGPERAAAGSGWS